MGPTTNDNLLRAAVSFYSTLRKYSPDQARDDHGRFAGGSSAGAAHVVMTDKALAEKIKKDGGFTYQPVTKDSPKPGDPVLSVSAFPEREKILNDKELTPAMLHDYVAGNMDLLSEHDKYFGAWHDTESGKIFLDVSILAKSKDEAIKIGAQHNQIAAFDFKTMSTVDIKPERRAEIAKYEREKSQANSYQRERGERPRQSVEAVRSTQGASRHGGRSSGTASADGEAASDSSLVKYNEDQPRDKDGKWTSDGSAAPSSPSKGGHPALTPEQQKIESDFRAKLESDHAGAVAAYAKLPDAAGGKILNVDTARELSPDYLKDRTQAAAVHEPSSDFIKEMYAEKLAQTPSNGEKPLVVFSAGGAGAGKSTGLQMAGEGLLRESQLVYDTNMSNGAKGIAKIDQALAAGKDVHVVYTYRDPVEALVNGALPRAMNQEKQFGSGRTVPIEDYLGTHTGAADAIREVAKHYANDPRVSFGYINNSLGRGQAKEVTLDELPKLSDRADTIRTQLYAALEDSHRTGKISDKVYYGFAGTGNDAAKAQKVWSSHADDRACRQLYSETAAVAAQRFYKLRDDYLRGLNS